MNCQNGAHAQSGQELCLLCVSLQLTRIEAHILRLRDSLEDKSKTAKEEFDSIKTQLLSREMGKAE